MKRNLLTLLITLLASGSAMNAQVPTSGLRAWYRADTLVTTSGNNVTLWGDASGNARTATVSSGIPTLNATGLNGRQAIFLNSGNFSLPNGTIPTGNSSYSIFFVARTGISVSGAFALLGGGTDLNGQYNGFRLAPVGISNSELLNYWWGGGQNDLFTSNARIAENTNYVFDFIYSSSSGRQIFVNNILRATNSLTSRNGGTTSNLLGGAQGSSNWNGFIAEVIIYDRAITAAERQTVLTYLYNKYGIQNAVATAFLPTNLTPASATLNGQVNPGGLTVSDAKFAFGTNQNNLTDSISIPSLIGRSDTSAIDVSGQVTGLILQRYFYRIVIRNARGTLQSNIVEFSPLPAIPFSGLQLWLRADSLVTQAGGLVSQWNDLSGNNRNAFSTGSARPSLVSSSATFGNRPVIDFGSIGDKQLGFRRVIDVRTAIIVARSTAPTTFQFLLGDSATFHFHPADANLVGTFASVNVQNGLVFLNGQQFNALAAARPSSPTVIMYETTGNATTSTIARDRTLTDNRGWRGEVAEVIIYSRVLSVAERAQVQSYLTRRYDINRPTVTVTGVTNISSSSATLNGIINPNGTSVTQAQFEYSLDPTFTTGVQTVNTTPDATGIGSGIAPVNVSATVSIQANSIYFFRLRTTNAFGTVVSESSSFSNFLLPPALPTAGLQLWLRADSLVTQAGGLVSQWNDLSGNNRNAFSTGSARPSLVSFSPTFGGCPVIDFGSVGDKQLGFRRVTDVRTAIIVGRSTAPTTFQFLLGDSTTFHFHPTNTNFVGNLAFTTVLSGLVFLNGQQFNALAAARPSAPTIIMFETTGNAETSTISNDRNLTDNRGWRGEVAEVIIYNRVLSVAERAQVQSYLAQRYNIGVQSTSATPSVAANTLGTFVLGSTGVTVTFTTASATAGSLSGSVTNSRPNVVGSLPTGIVNLAERFWTINQTGLTGFNCAVTFNLSTLGGIQNFNTLKVLRRNNSSSPWVDVETISGVTITRNAPFITVAGITSFSDFVIASDASNTLPVEVSSGLPKTFALEQNYPNPFNPTTVIAYQLPAVSNVSLKLYDVLGKEVMTLVNGRQDAGQYSVSVNASALASGVYFYRLQASATNGASGQGFVSTKKMMLVK